MLGFEIVDVGNHFFRCLLGDEVFFDFSVDQFELFGYEHVYSQLKRRTGYPVYNNETLNRIGEVVSVRYLKPEDSIWILIRNGIRGEIFTKDLGG